MKKIGLLFKYALILLVAALLSFCTKQNNPDPEPEPDKEQQEAQRLLLKANKFVYDLTSEAYLWSSHIPSNVTYRSADDPEALFELMRYQELD